MSLPSGYKRLEYIQSSGTQYVNTGITINATTYKKYRFLFDIGYPSISGSYWLVNGNSGSNVIYYFGLSNTGKIVYGNGTTDVFGSVTATTGRYLVDFNPSDGSYKFGSLQNLTGLTFNAPSGSQNFYLFAYNKGNGQDMHTERLFSAKIYDNGTLIRDYIPCQTIAGKIGLWDDVNSVFYGNAGTGTFTAGPVLIPDAPSDLTSSVDDGTVTLSWSAVSGATGYKISRDGVLISTQTVLTYTETVTKGQTYTYSVVAYNDYGDSDPATLSVNVPLVPPSTPSNFAASVSGLSATLSWDAPAKATGYRLYRDGVLLSDQTDTVYIDAVEPFVSYVYTLIAYNDDGDSPAATLTVTVVLPPSAPAELRMTARTRTTISLAWDAVSGAEGYRLYRDGVQIYSGADTAHTDTGLSTETTYTYAVEAFNSGGASTRVTLEATTTGLVLITDRTQADVDRIRELAKKLNAGTATVEELAEWNSIVLKGSYDYSDLNRVGDAVQYLSEILKSHGYDCPVSPKLDWLESGRGAPSDMAQYLQNVQTLRGILTLLPETPNVPADMEKLTWQEANAIEQIIVDLESTIKTMLKTRVACGDAYCGGEYL